MQLLYWVVVPTGVAAAYLQLLQHAGATAVLRYMRPTLIASYRNVNVYGDTYYNKCFQVKSILFIPISLI